MTTYTYRISSDAATQTIEAESADAAVCTFDGSPDVETFAARVLDLGGWATIHSDDDPEMMVDVNIGSDS